VNKAFMNGKGGLHIRCHDLGMFLQVEEEGITGPAAFGLHYLKGDTLKKVFEGCLNSDAVALKRIHFQDAGGLGQAF